MKLVLAIALSFALPACSPGEFSGSLDQRLPARPGGLLQVDLDLGPEARHERVAIEVRSHDADEVWAVADVSGPGASSVSFRLEHDDAGVRVYGRSYGLLSWLFGGPSVQLRVFVPREFSVDLRSGSGPIRVEDVTGSLRARTTDGALEVRGAEGPVRLRTHGGQVAVAEVQGDVEIRAQDGSIELGWITGAVDARTGQGNLAASHLDGRVELRADSGEIELRDVRGQVSAKTESGSVYASFLADPSGVIETQRGSVEVSLPAAAKLALDARSGRGRVEIGEGLDVNGTRGEDRAAGTLNGGGETLRIYTARGSVRVEPR
ncbi:MAG: DUF4097 family beta strand repeat-containing protein [Myxococcota bacterium]